jgi:hypothetical protein
MTRPPDSQNLKNFSEKISLIIYWEMATSLLCGKFRKKGSISNDQAAEFSAPSI